jgi:hypothetical protein
MGVICIGDCYPPKELFPFWDVVTGNAPVNDYSILGYQMLVVGYLIMLWLIPMVAYFMYTLIKMIPYHVKGKFDMNGKRITEAKP